ncbi:hypothetical protein H7F33_17580 [Pedobacter sp. PAMC26386]|nr:hypothetical protein H7F33_17580 [Pedobacter sp. PAMC26386]
MKPGNLLLETLTVDMKSDGKYFLSFNDKQFYVGKIVYEIINQLKQKKELSEIKSHLLEKLNVDLNYSELENTIQDITTKITGDKDPIASSGLHKYIYCRINLFSEATLFKITKPMSPLFKKWVFIAFTILAILVNGTFLSIEGLKSSISSFGNLGVTEGSLVLIGIYVVTLLLMVVHEFGHSAATYYWGLKPKLIGFGLYIIFPALFTDVTSIWQLDKYKRCMVNFGGIYFQSLIGVFLIAIFWVTPHEHILFRLALRSIIISNVLIAVYSLNPFLRNDGYWLYSDFFNLTNLMKQSIFYPVKLFSIFVLKNTIKYTYTGFSKELPILLYSAAHYVFVSWFTILFFANFKVVIHEFQSIINYTNLADFKFGIFLRFLFSSLIIVLFSVRLTTRYIPYLTRLVRNNYKYIYSIKLFR